MVAKWQLFNQKLWLSVPVITAGALIYFGSTVLAQVKPDRTLGKESSVVTPVSPKVDRIDGGAVRGSNLFHSFKDFNVGEGRRVNFTNPAGIDNILSRVTGGNASNILGTLGVLGNANLYLLNPNGIIFGPNARLDIRGSFVASTGKGITFEDRILYGANNSGSKPLLTMAVPVGLQYGTQQGGNISNAGNLKVGKDLTLSAGNLDLQGQLQAGRNLTLQATDTVRIRDSSGYPFIAQARGDLLIQGNQKTDIFVLNHPASGLFSGEDMIMRSANTVGGDANYTTGGSFKIEQMDGSLGKLYSPYDPVIRANGDVNFSSYEGASLHIFAGGSVNIPGSIKITEPDQANSIVEDVLLSDGSTVRINGATQATLDIRAGTVILNNPLGITGTPPPTGLTTTNNPTSADITIGSINIVPTSGLIFLTNQYFPNTSLSGGSISTTGLVSAVRGLVTIDARSGISLGSDGNQSIDVSTATANGGNIRLLNASGDINIANRLRTSSGSGGGDGDAGDILIENRAGSVNIQGMIEQNGVSNANSSAGNLDIIVANGDITVSSIQASAFNLVTDSPGVNGNGGKVTLNAEGNITTNGEIFTFVEPGRGGTGGSITLKSKTGTIDTSAGILWSSSDIGNAGAISLEANGKISTSNIFSNSSSNGKAGDITLISNGGKIDTSVGILSASSGTGNLLNQILGLNTGNGGNILLDAKNGNISSGSIESTGLKGGRITLTSSNEISLNQADIASINTGNFGKGSNIEFTAPIISLTNARVVSLSTGNIPAGDVIIKASEEVKIKNEGSSSTNLIGVSPLFQFLKQQPDFRGTGFISTTFRGNGDTGNITIDTKRLSINNNAPPDLNSLAGIATLTLQDSSYNAGDITVNASESVTIVGNELGAYNPSGSDTNEAKTKAREIQSIRTGITSATQGEGNAGKTTINTGNLEISNGAAITSGVTNEGTGQGNEITVNAATVKLSGKAALATASIGANSDNFGSNPDKTGDLTVNSDRITLLKGALIAADTFGQRKGGNLTINTNELKISDGSRISAATFDIGQGGTIRINNPENKAQLVQIEGTSKIDGISENNQARSGIFSDSRASGNAGNIEMFTDTLNIQNSGEVSVSSFGSGLSGNMNINSDQVILQEEASITADTFASGKGGDLNINTVNLSIMNGSQIGAKTFDTGQGGSAQVTAREKIIIDGRSSTNNEVRSSLTANSQEGDKAGNLNINTKGLEVLNGGQIAVSSTGKGISGDMIVTADSILLKNQASINALTESTQGGDINIKVANDIEFEGRDSEISSEALLENAGGGKLNIEAGGFITSSGVPNNNDVVVTAGGRGKGGDIFVKATGIFGFVNFNQFRTPDSDLSAASRLGQNGTVTPVTNNPQPQLPQQPNVREIVQVCPSSQGVTTRAAGRSEYINTGHGGLPPNPNEALESNTAQVPWVTLNSEENQTTSAASSTLTNTSTPKVIREAQGWIKMPNGKLLLTTQNSNSSSLSCVFQTRQP